MLTTIVLLISYRGSDFRKDYRLLGELRSLVPEGISFIALTTTATSCTKIAICKSLHLCKPFVVKSLPNRMNIIYSVMKVKNSVTDNVSDFRKDYSLLGVLRSLVPEGISFIALTTTATSCTKIANGLQTNVKEKNLNVTVS